MSKRDQISTFKEARQSMIIRPQTAHFGKRFDPWISSSSPVWQRRAVVQLARYLSMETGYRMDLNESVATWRDGGVNAFAITDCIQHNNGNEHEALVGTAIFYIYSEEPTLYHCYLHPFFRNRKLLQKYWEELRRRYPEFKIEPPISNPMQALLVRLGYRITNGQVVGRTDQAPS